jgi:rhodanese-related sulfurtransferase
MQNIVPFSFQHPSAIICVSLRQKRLSMKHTQGFLSIVNDAKTRVKETDVPTIKKRMDAGEKFHLVDVREDSEWEKGHIPGAIHLGKGVIERDVETVIPDHNAEIVLYCGGGFRSALSADNLQKMGYTNVLSLDGGWRGWTEAGHPVEKEWGRSS